MRITEIQSLRVFITLPGTMINGKTPCDLMNNILDHILRADARMNFMVLFLIMTLVCAKGPTPSTVQWQQFWGQWERREEGNPILSSVCKLPIQLDVETEFSKYRKYTAPPASNPPVMVSLVGTWDECWLACGHPTNVCTQLFFVAGREHAHLPEQHLSGDGGWKQGSNKDRFHSSLSLSLQWVRVLVAEPRFSPEQVLNTFQRPCLSPPAPAPDTHTQLSRLLRSILLPWWFSVSFESHWL